MELCQCVDLCFHALSLPCLHAFWHAIPTSFYIFKSCYNIICYDSLAVCHTCRELLEDSNLHSAVQRVVEEPMPYFTQFRSCPQPSEATIQSAHQHLYATGLEDNSSRGLPPPSTPPLSPTSQSQCLTHSDVGSSAVHSELDVEAHAESTASVQEEPLTNTTELDSRIKQ